MPEIRFQIQWPDGSEDICYSPSLIVKEYFVPQETYNLEDFITRSRTALNIASDRVKAKYGMPCSMALGQLKTLETKADLYRNVTQPQVKVLKFIE